MTDQEIEFALRACGQPYPGIPHCADALGVEYPALVYRIAVSPDSEKPEAHGAFRAGGRMVFQIEAAVKWCIRHQRYWAERQSQRGTK